ncbi:MAG: retroviral-like aspartic protease family protein [Burkholderiales bacterium]|nr:retroviral-like aspartic protease family protein [Burkholderiales bacterium]
MASALLLASLSVAAASARAACKLEQMEIPVRIVDRRPIATLTLNGTPMPMLVDSGAFFSMLSPSAATQLKLPLRNLPPNLRIEGYTGRIEAKLTRVEKVGLLTAELWNIEFLVGGNELGAGIMGIMGRNILSAGDTEYDLAHGVVRLSFPKGECDKTSFAYWAGEAPVIVAPLDREQHREDSAIRMSVSINGVRTQALLDTGAPRTSLTLKAARRAGIEERDLTPNGRSGGAGTGLVKSWTGRVALFELGGEKIADNRLEVDDTDNTDHGVLVGLDYFLSHRIYVSRLQRQVYVTWNGSPIFAQGSETPGTYDARFAALPQDVAKDDPDALARRGAAAMAAGNYPRALEDLNRACELAPGVAEYFFARARVHLAMRQSRPALADLDEALRLDPALADARYRRARVRSGLGDRPGAQADLALLDAALPPPATLRADMAEMYAGFGQASEALRQFDLWIGSHPKDVRLAGVLNSRCWMRARLNIDLPLALEDCKQAVDRDGGSASYLDSLGWTYLRLGDGAKSKTAFDDAIKLQALPFSLYGRALAHLLLNDPAGGERDLAAARKLKPQIDEDVRKEGFDFAQAVERLKVPGS